MGYIGNVTHLLTIYELPETSKWTFFFWRFFPTTEETILSVYLGKFWAPKSLAAFRVDQHQQRPVKSETHRMKETPGNQRPCDLPSQLKWPVFNSNVKLGGGFKKHAHPYMGEWANLTNILQMGWNLSWRWGLGLDSSIRLYSRCFDTAWWPPRTNHPLG